ncbi:glycoside hydrolase family 5 protein [Pseudochryseolinea flava]|uniref:Glycoside hydrolase family 5 protein n=1 Tax=Pseudochryseolinea flava TaxID=2059302 RepID=A0A364XYT3_9BACT|nr:glycoside hydrolase family 5 protein [Pseudochryseolinea flava]RAV99440.1 glycoside hydrolase family 5 protein [Pseudochryseolinea flava]
MKKSQHTSLFILMIMTILMSCKSTDRATIVDRSGQLQAKGNRIVDRNGTPIQLYGMSFFWSQWMGKYYNAETVSWLKQDWNCTILRAAMGIEGGGYLQNPAREEQKIITVVDAAIANGLYVIIDWHDHHGENHLQESKTFFASMAKRYGGYPNVIYELYNEPLQVSWSKVLKPYHEAVIDTIRKYDTKNLIVCGTPNWSQWVDSAALDPIKDSNVAYTLHFYAGTHKQELRDRAKFALDRGIALMVTEYGTTDANGNGAVDTEETERWFAFMDEYKLSGCNWSVADKNESSAALKPGAAPSGGWSEDMINPSGLLVRSKHKRQKQ